MGGYTTTYNPLGSSMNTANGFSGVMVWTIISLVLAIIGGIAVYILFVNKKDKFKDKKIAWIKDFLDFKNIILEKVIKISYLILTIFITLTSFNYIGSNFAAFLSQLIIGNIVLRVIYEASILLLQIWKNTSEINKKIK